MKIKRILIQPSLFDEMNLESQKQIEKQLGLLSLEQLEKIMKSIPLEEGDKFYQCVAKIYARHFAQNLYQEKILIDSFINQRIMSRAKKRKKAKSLERVQVKKDKLNFC